MILTAIHWAQVNWVSLMGAFLALQGLLAFLGKLTGNKYLVQFGSILGEILSFLQRVFPTKQQIKNHYAAKQAVKK